ncbi:MAG: hypothetical protein ACOC6F_02795 [bacterium]
MARIGIQPTYAIAAGDLNFAPQDFFSAAGEAVNGRAATVMEISTEEQVTFQPCTDLEFPGGFCFEHPETGDTQTFVSEDLELLLDSLAEREAVLRRNRHWFDCPQETFDQVVAEIVSTQNPQSRMEEMRSWRESSASVFYRELQSKLKKEGALDLAALRPPSAEGLARHLRLGIGVKIGESFRKALDTAAETLISEEGLVQTIDRLAGLPVALPGTVVEAVARLSPQETYALIKRLVRTAGSPVSRLHLVHLLLNCDGLDGVFRRLARRVLAHLLSPQGTGEFRAFLEILKWVSDEFRQRPDMQEVPPNVALALAWMHAHRLSAIFAYLGISVDWLQNTFGRARLGLSSETFDRDPGYWFDVSHPRRVNYATLLVCGLDYALGEDERQLMNGKMATSLDAIAFRSLEGRRVLAPHLLVDYTRATNSLSSFLGGDIAEKGSNMLTGESATGFSKQVLKKVVEQALETLLDETDELSGWMSLYAVLGDLPIYEDLSGRLKSLIRQTDFVALLERDVKAGRFAMAVASSQVMHLDDQELTLYLRDELLSAARLLANWDSEQSASSGMSDEELDSLEDLALLLIESALDIALASDSSQEASTRFADTLAEFVEVWPSIVPHCKPVVQVLSEELPISEAQHFWPILVRLRAE